MICRLDLRPPAKPARTLQHSSTRRAYVAPEDHSLLARSEKKKYQVGDGFVQLARILPLTIGNGEEFWLGQIPPRAPGSNTWYAILKANKASKAVHSKTGT